MKFGLFYLIQGDEARTPQTAYQRFWETVEEVTYAEQMGFESSWMVEHHFEPEHSYSSTPEITLTALSQRTSTMRFGFGVAMIPTHHPLRLAAQIATMDILSNGRIDFGAGRSKTPHQLAPFGVGLAETRGKMIEALTIIPKMWTEEMFSHEGQYYQMPPREVVPKPVQQPHPPMWLACSQEETLQIAGELGIGCLMNVTGGIEKTATSIETYRQSIKGAKPVGKFINDRVMCSMLTYCDEHSDRALERGGEIGAWTKNVGLTRNNRLWEGVDTSSVPDDYRVYLPGGGNRQMEPLSPEDFLRRGGHCVGTPDSCIQTLEQYEALGVEGVLCSVQHGLTTHQEAMNTIRLFGKYVIPHFLEKESKASTAHTPVSAE
jgi:alkanesulfonate monooxygenase SsuD/methylene tetrahydromethanopterin reductase-like flavin-dependent oxidoreductase (luciferase family)